MSLSDKVLVSRKDLEAVLDYLNESESDDYRYYVKENGTDEGHILKVVSELFSEIEAQ